MELLNAGAYINDQDYYGCTSLHVASKYGNTECIITLLNAGADINEKDNFGRTALDVESNKIKDFIKKSQLKNQRKLY